ncbi:membrane protein [Hyphomicrobium nitrativorans NL23]|uniref:Guanidinium exporter n=1 Tax=Hyphomicrobium nitrativorans NL23 TaxID=1029756 RepID=V5SG21_9HYPH|nr:multidrug efflux SMR transporter [Hyphomicrobium nitrativorans]AHB49452.1 membrane protein [Hyphomicrobium nitrativorans NL23]
MAWLMLIVAGVFEVGWAFSMKQSDGFTRLWPSVITVVLMAISIVLLAAAMRSLPLGTAYTVWTGIGAIGAFLVGIVVLSEPATALRMLAAVLIVSGIVLMKVSSTN